MAPATGVRTTRLCRPLKRRSSRALADRSRGSSRPATNDCAPDALASTASRPAFVTTRDRPSVGRDGNGYRFDSSQADTEIFLQKGLDRKTGKTPTDLPVGQNQWCGSCGASSHRRPREGGDPSTTDVCCRQNCGSSFAQNGHSWLWVPDRVRFARLSGTTWSVQSVIDFVICR